MKLVSMFFTASAENLRALAQIYEQTSKKHEACSTIFTAKAAYLLTLNCGRRKKQPSRFVLRPICIIFALAPSGISGAII